MKQIEFFCHSFLFSIQFYLYITYYILCYLLIYSYKTNSFSFNNNLIIIIISFHFTIQSLLFLINIILTIKYKFYLPLITLSTHTNIISFLLSSPRHSKFILLPSTTSVYTHSLHSYRTINPSNDHKRTKRTPWNRILH